MADKTILVTGGAGYVGSHACKALAQASYEPVTYDSLIRGHRELVKWGPLEVGDVCDGNALDAVMKRHKPSAVMHFAALTLVGESVANPALYHRTNAGGTATLLATMQRNGVGRIIVSGTCAVYGIPATNPITEEAAIAPINPYGESKLAMETQVAEAGVSTGLSHVILRYFNAAGADPDGETGEWHEPETHLIPNVLRAAAGLGDRLCLYGDDYPTPDGTCIRDYIHVCDIASVYVMTGPVYLRDMPPLPKVDEPHKVPSGYWKIVSIQDGESLKVASFFFDQETQRKELYCDHLTMIADIESKTGLKFFRELTRETIDQLRQVPASLRSEIGCQGEDQ